MIFGVLTEHELSDLRSRGWLDDMKAEELRELSNRYILTIAARDEEIARLQRHATILEQHKVAASAHGRELFNRIAQLEAVIQDAIETAEEASCFCPPMNEDEAPYFAGWRAASAGIARDIHGLVKLAALKGTP